jgi:hypothetical protein
MVWCGVVWCGDVMARVLCCVLLFAVVLCCVSHVLIRRAEDTKMNLGLLKQILASRHLSKIAKLQNCPFYHFSIFVVQVVVIVFINNSKIL